MATFAIFNYQFDKIIEHSRQYTLEGMKLNGQPTKKGVYIHKGKKVSVE